MPPPTAGRPASSNHPATCRRSRLEEGPVEQAADSLSVAVNGVPIAKCRVLSRLCQQAPDLIP